MSDAVAHMGLELELAGNALGVGDDVLADAVDADLLPVLVDQPCLDGGLRTRRRAEVVGHFDVAAQLPLAEQKLFQRGSRRATGSC